MATYAAQTNVPVSRSRDEIEKTLTRYGATGFAFAQEDARAMVGFVAHERTIRMIVPLPQLQEFSTTATGRSRTKKSQQDAYEQALRQRWRSLALIVKAKLQSVESGIVSFEQEFAVHMVLPDGTTVGDHVLPAIDTAYRTGQVGGLIPQRALGTGNTSEEE